MPARRGWRVVGGVLLALLLVLGVALVVGIAWLRSETGSARVTARAASAIGRAIGLELELGRFALHGRHMALGPIVVRDPAADSAAAPFARIEQVRLELDWARFLVRRGRVHTLTIEHPVITVPRAATGELQWPRFGGQGAPRTTPLQVPFARFTIDELAIRNGQLVLAAPPSGGRPVTVDSVGLLLSADLDFRTPQTDVTLRELTGVWREGDLALDTAAARVLFGPVLGPSWSDLQLTAPPWRLTLASAPITVGFGVQARRARLAIDAPELPAGALAGIDSALARLPEMSVRLQAEGPVDLAGEIPIALELESRGARAALTAELRAPRTRPSLRVTKLAISDLDPSRFDARAPQGKVTLSAEGEVSRAPSGLASSFRVQIARGSRLRAIPVAGQVRGRLADKVWTIDELGLELAQAQLRASGQRAADGRIASRFEVNANDLAPLAALLGVPLAGDLNGNGRADGPPEALRITAALRSQSLQVDDQVAVHGLTATLDLRPGKQVRGRVEAHADSIAARSRAHLHAVQLTAEAVPEGARDSALRLSLHAARAILDRTALPPGALDLAGRGRLRNGAVTATIDTLALAGVAELQAPLALELARHPQTLELEGLDLAIAGGRVSGDLQATRTRRAIHMRVEQVALAELAALAGLDSVVAVASDTTVVPALQGTLSADLDLTDAGAGPAGEVTVGASEILFGAWPTPPLTLSVASQIAPDAIAGSARVEAEDDSVVVRGTIPIEMAKGTPRLAWDRPALALDVHAAGDSLAPYLGRVLASIPKAQPFAVRLRQRLSTTDVALALRATGRPRDPATELTLDLDLAPLDPLGPGAIQLSAKRPADTLAVAGQFTIEGMAKPLTVDARLPILLDLEARTVHVAEEAPIAGAVDLTAFELELIDAFKDSDIAGLLTVIGTVSGTRSAPTIAGRVSLERGHVDLHPLGLELDSLAVAADFTGQELRLHSATGRTEKGHLRMQGALPLSGNRTAGVQLNADITGLGLRTPSAMKALGDAKLTVTGTMAKPVIEGKLVLHEASIPLPEKGRKTMVKIPADDPWLKGTQVATGSRQPLQGRALPIDLNLTVEVPRNLWLRNDDINVEIGGDLKITTPNDQLRVEGDLKTREGSVRLLNRRFQVTKGTVSFYGAKTLLPNIDITAETQVRETTVEIHLTGTIEEPKLDFASTPSHSESDIVSLLLFGRTATELSSGETNFVSEQAGMVAASYVSATLEREVGQKLGLDVLEIQAAEGNERVAVGKYVSSNTLVRAYQEMGTESYGGVAVEHALTNEFDLEVSADDRGQSGIDLLWKRGD